MRGKKLCPFWSVGDFFADGSDGGVVDATLMIDDSVVLAQNFNERGEKD